MDKLIILRSLLSRLEPEVGSVAPTDFSWFADDPPPEHEYRAQSGWYHKAMAVFEARTAIESGTEDELNQLASVLPTIERTGNEFEARALKRTAQDAASAAQEAARAADEAKSGAEEAQRAEQEAKRAAEEAMSKAEAVERAAQERELASETLLKSRREAGGKQRGQNQHDASMKILGPHIKKYHAYLALGLHYLTARKKAITEMNLDGVGNNLSERTIRKWFPKPKKIGTQLS